MEGGGGEGGGGATTEKCSALSLPTPRRQPRNGTGCRLTLVLIRLGLAWVFVAFFVSDSSLLVVFFCSALH